MGTTPPGPKGLPLVGNGQQYAKDPFAFMSACEAAYGDVVRLDLGPRETYMLTNPADVERVLVSEAAKFGKPRLDDALFDLLGDGLLLSNGETWERQRELASPAFHASRVAGLGDLMVDHAETMLDGWAPDDRVDVHAEMARVTVRIIVSAMFGTDIDDDRLTTVRENLEPLGRRFEPNPVRTVIPDWAPTRENREFDAAVETLQGVIGEILDERRGTAYDAADPAGDAVDGDEPMDLLSVLLRARDRGEQTDEQLRDELMTMLLAGHDTTALALTYAWYLLSNHPEARERFHAEVDELDGRPTAADVRSLTYTDHVLSEAMRLYPPVYTLFREPRVDVRLGGFRVPEGSIVMLPQWAVHRSERWYDDPLAFDPDRWEPDRQGDRPRFAHFPFGGGPRHCIGKRLSMLEAKLILASVGREYELNYEGPELDLRGSITMHPDHPVPMRLRER
ncbi:cytochrome P450 [Candidatus Halobonum tyrrellensis]|uniref:Cytochrome P450 n=1 Tax=Candidatus Halobonum tyrrellensis G22 TaxID=1324957 RepID=V4GRR4_9EURY|nr:cytochrome P450 [Candidatus Halobonum tyrrellensis]ESP87746.1 cytochrome P450 [Candidatus Halobonum tyrrellensis G22]